MHDFTQDSLLTSSPKKPSATTTTTPAPLPKRPSKAPWLIGGAVAVGGVFWWMSRASAASPPAPTPGPTPDPNPPKPDPDPAPKPDPAPEKDPSDFLAEVNACTDVSKNKPASFKNRVRPVGMSDAEWLALIGYWQAYPLGPVQPKGTAYADAYVRILECVKERLAAEPKPEPKPDEPPPVIPPAIDFGPRPDNIAKQPTPDKFYTIVWGDNFTKLTKAAYGAEYTKRFGQPFEGPHVLKVMRAVNDYPYNLRFRVMVESEKGFFPNGRISFSQIFGDLAEQTADGAKGGRDLPGSSYYATFFFPPANEVL